MPRSKRFWIKVGILGGIKVALVWGLVMWGIFLLGMDGDPEQILWIAPGVGLFFGIVFPVTMAWLERRSEASASEAADD